MGELWITVTGHSQVIVALAWANNPTPKGLPQSKLGIHLVWQTKIMAHEVMHGDDHPTNILHPTLGSAYALLHQEGQVPQLASPLTNCSFIPVPAILFLPFSFQVQSLTFKQTSNYLRMSVLRCWASTFCDHTWPYCNCINWDRIAIKWLLACNMDEQTLVRFTSLPQQFICDAVTQGSNHSKAFLILRRWP